MGDMHMGDIKSIIGEATSSGVWKLEQSMYY